MSSFSIVKRFDLVEHGFVAMQLVEILTLLTIGVRLEVIPGYAIKSDQALATGVVAKRVVGTIRRT